MKKNRGFTLLEMLFVVLIMMVLLGIMVVVVTQSKIIFEASDITVILGEKTRQAQERCFSDLANTNRTMITITENFPFVGSDRISYRLPEVVAGVPVLTAGGAVTWNATACSIYINPAETTQLIKMDSNGVTTVISNNARSINFIDHDMDPNLYLDELRVAFDMRTTDSQGRGYTAVSNSITRMRN